MRRPLAALFVLSAFFAPLACAPSSLPDGGVTDELDAGGLPFDAGREDAGPIDTGYPPPRSDLVRKVGTALTLDIATWNIENFPQSSTTPEVVADLITSLDLDVIAVQEIRDVEAFEELDQRLPHHKGVLSPHTYGDGSYQKVGFLYREDLVSLTGVTTIFSGSGYQFPRPPLQATLTVRGTDLDFTLITVHLKAGLGREDQERRAASIELLAGHIKSLVDGPGEDEIMLLGDFNETVDSTGGRQNLAPILSDDTFRFLTEDIANQGTPTYLPSNVMLDHIVTTTALDDELEGALGPKVPRIDNELPTYRGNVSDHLPVVISLPLP